ncbi:fructose-bisphosphate aldolase, partial [Lactobacillus salivarius]|nr:fructose-bisphosphate aldolase [Ligilactobacillus salivarius]
IVASAFKMPSISQAVADFRNDWESLYGDKNINNL